MSVHVVEPSETTITGYFDPELEPIISVESGDTVVFRTLDGSWGRMAGQLFGAEPALSDRPRADDGHPLCGPVRVKGARPGDVLQVEIGRLRPGTWGWTSAGPRKGRLRYGVSAGHDVLMGWRIDADARTAEDAHGLGIVLPIRPFLGVMGTTPAGPGRYATRFPRRVGGNMDCRELVSGSVLYLPIAVAGALFCVGDGHALQGDGEIASTALECPMDEAALTFRLRSDFEITGPRADTPGGYLSMGFGDDLDDAIDDALPGILTYLQRKYGIDESRAIAVASLVANLRITQIANGTVGVHALVRHD